ncbi:MAG: ATP-binding protein [Bacteroidales bacterium]|nr:ATP-binding protein [Bacteroidales bacterium]
MSTRQPSNPFSSTNYQGPDYFCNRTEETSRLLNNIINGNSTTIISVRRIGKTGLIQHVFNQLPRGWRGIYIDILETETLNQFLNILATGILNAVPEKSSIGRKFWETIKSLRPVITFDTLTGEPKASFDLKHRESETNINALLQFLEKQEFRVLIAIDEFQQIMHYPEKNTDAWLRSRIQQLKNVVFIFSGSQQHLMSDLFASPKRPFFRSTQMLKLEKIKSGVYCDFIVNMFNKYHKEISKEIATDVLYWTNTHTFYVQQLCNRVFAATEKKVNPESWRQQAFMLLQEQETVFFTYRNMLTPPQWHLLKAIASEGKVFMPTSASFINKYGLGSSATVLRSLKTLNDFELIYTEFDLNGEKYYSVYDVFFQRWIEGK